MRKYFLLLIILFVTADLQAQDSVWTLEGAIHYAFIHNIDINQSVLNERLAKLQWEQSKWSQLPNASVSGSYGYNFGRSIDPTSNQFVNSGYSFAGLNGNTDVLLFGWFQKRRRIEQNHLLYQAAGSDKDQLMQDVALNVATGYLRILLAKEQVTVAGNQLQLSHQQLSQTKAFVDAGTKPELDMEQMKAQLAADSSAYITAVSNVNAAVLDIKALLNLDMKSDFDVEMPDMEDINFGEAMSLSADHIYNEARQHFGSIKGSELKEQAARRAYLASRGALYPQLGIGYQIGSNYASSLKEVTDYNVMGAEPTTNFVNINGTAYQVYQPTFDFSQRTIPFFNQLDNNLRQSVALTLSVPLLNGWMARTQVKQAAIDVQSKKLSRDQSELKLQQDVYKAHNDAQAAIQKYFATHSATAASQKAYEYAQKRYELGLMNSVELLATQNTALKAKTDEASAKYDMIFKLKMIDYYLGKDLKL